MSSSVFIKPDWKSFRTHLIILLLLLFCVADVWHRGLEYAYVFIFGILVLLYVFAMSSLGEIGRKILYVLCWLELSFPFCMAAGSLAHVIDLPAPYVPLFLAAPALILAWVLQQFFKLERRFERINLRLFGIIFIALALAFACEPIFQFLNSLGTTWPVSYDVALRNLGWMHDHGDLIAHIWIGALVAMLCGEHLDFRDIKMEKALNTVLLVCLTVVLEGIIMPLIFLMAASARNMGL